MHCSSKIYITLLFMPLIVRPPSLNRLKLGMRSKTGQQRTDKISDKPLLDKRRTHFFTCSWVRNTGEKTLNRRKASIFFFFFTCLSGPLSGNSEFMKSVIYDKLKKGMLPNKTLAPAHMRQMSESHAHVLIMSLETVLCIFF